MGDNKQWKEMDCHFDWDLEHSIAQKGSQQLISYLLKDMRMNADVETKAMVTLGFVYAMNDQSDEAEQMTDKAIAACENKQKTLPDNEGYLAVALANKAHILHHFGKPGMIQMLNAAVSAFQSSKDHLQAQGGISGLMGYTFSLFEDRLMDGIACFKKAVQQDPKNFEWPLGICILSHRARLRFEGHRTLPTKMEEDTAHSAIKLSNRKKGLPIALLADVMLAQGQGQAKGQDVPAKKAAAAKLYHEAYNLEPKCTYILKRCGKAFSLLQDATFAEKCLKEALELDEGNAVVLHRLGQLYEFSEQKKDLQLAEHYYQMAVDGDNTQKRNAYADIDLARIRSKQNNKYNILQHYQSIRQYYLGNPKDLALVDGAIKRQVEYLESANTRTFDRSYPPNKNNMKKSTRQY